MSRPSKSTPQLIALAAVGALSVAAIGFWVAGTTDLEGWRHATRFTARFSFAWFLAVWSASALARVWPGGWRSALFYNRRGVGLGFATAHLIHAFFFSVEIWGLGHATSLTTMAGGGLGYVFVLLLALTSNDYWVKRLTPGGWKLLHTVGVNYIAVIFAFTYYGALARGSTLLGGTTLALLGAVLLVRIAAFAAARRPRLA